ncbi:sigma factor-like helix-turn-helix DNA-binding protein [Chitinophaga sp. Cy-1792]|uniref:sigma factor-like helix-turn-helix DNA-binding protein n=1 Tax=Chitinophaga sp. Cy-1792 TaxID=2608339 RepID=UPI0014237072|nr:sigma factor-like helix-turn-helix DNA-binding protein [Chitinophaga sp. Cy-1792]NIG55140.1 RNA polymerase subunit sigma-24 [Chitinophaga sp. Cy-1792]
MKDYQQILFPYAYNILGSAEDAKDVIQDVISRHYMTPREGILDEKNYLIKSVINLAINYKNKNKKIAPQRAEWLPEPVATDDNADKNLHLRDILSYSLMIMMEKLSTMERAVFILRESFDYDHKDISEVLNISEEYSRKLLSRAKARLFKPGAVTHTPGQQQKATDLLSGYIDAIRQGDVKRVENMLSAEITMIADGGPHLHVVRKICIGATEVAPLLELIFNKYQATANIVLRWINHQPAFLFYVNDRLTSCQVFEINEAGDTILQINNVVDPEKLKALQIS